MGITEGSHSQAFLSQSRHGFLPSANKRQGGFDHQERWLQQRDILLTSRLHVENAEA